MHWRDKNFMDLLKQGMTFTEFKKATDCTNPSNEPEELLIIEWTLLRKAILKLCPSANYMKIKDKLEWCNAHENDKSFLDIDWEELEEIFKRFKVVK